MLDRRDRDFFVLVVAILLIFALSLWPFGISIFKPASYLLNASLYAGLLFIIFGYRVIRLAVIDRPDQLTRAIIEREFNPERQRQLMWAVPVLISIIIFGAAFSAMKSAIPLFNPFSWDPYFITLDQRLHGTDPWRLLQPVLGYPLVTALLSLVYHLWLLLLYAIALFFAFRQKDAELRQRFFITYVLAWAVIGVAMAALFSSVGPCFVEPITGSPHFAEQMAYLKMANQHYPVMVLDVQDGLLQGYLNSDRGLGRGITAMPSMHLAIATVFFLSVRRFSKAMALGASIFVVIIQLGSVHLAYHYAVDGYVSIFVTALLWKAVGLWTKSKRYAGNDA
jgi:hypothetical protein